MPLCRGQYAKPVQKGSANIQPREVHALHCSAQGARASTISDRPTLLHLRRQSIEKKQYKETQMIQGAHRRAQEEATPRALCPTAFGGRETCKGKRRPQASEVEVKSPDAELPADLPNNSHCMLSRQDMAAHCQGITELWVN